MALGSASVPRCVVVTGSDSPEDYCRQLESYLCRKNEGHLIRIVGPAFEQVCGWATRGIPIQVACRGIDRYFERYYAKGRGGGRCGSSSARRTCSTCSTNGAARSACRRGPGWRRRRGRQRVTARTSRARHRPADVASGWRRSALDSITRRIVRELDAARAGAKNLRGEARSRPARATADARAGSLSGRAARLDAATVREIEREAESELAPFRDRMPADAYQRSRAACIDRIVARQSAAAGADVRMIQRGARLTLDIEKPAAGGRMLARHAGQVVLVSGTIPGERVTAASSGSARAWCLPTPRRF